MSVDDNIGGDVGNKENRSPDKLHVVARFEHEDYRSGDSKNDNTPKQNAWVNEQEISLHYTPSTIWANTEQSGAHLKPNLPLCTAYLLTSG